MKKRYFFIIMLLMFLFSDCKKENSNITNIEQELIDEIHKRGLPSVAVCIVNNNQISWEWVYGHANLKEQIVADRETIYNFMSISKVFIAVSVMQLVENEKLKLDDDINKYLPYDVRNPKYPDIPISVRMLLTHTSGIAHPDGETWDYEIYYLYHGDDMPRISEWVPQYILPGGTAYRNNVWKDFKPGEKELYSNIATSLLAIIVEQVSGLTYEEYCRINIFEPLEMNNSGFLYSEVNAELLAVPYINMHNAYPLYNFKAYPAANLKSNIEDFSHFMIAMLNRGEYKGKKILEPQSVEEMFMLNSTSSGVGLIWRNCPGDCIGHSGGGEGFSTRFELFPDRKKAMIILSNRRNTTVYPQGRIYDLVRYQCDQL